MNEDRRCFRYRLGADGHGEARLFGSPDVVPPGWQDSPAKVGPVTAAMPPEPQQPENTAMPAPDVVPDEKEILRRQAEALGITVDGRWSIKRLRLEIEEAAGDGNGA